jgi:hypothetical protein
VAGREVLKILSRDETDLPRGFGHGKGEKSRPFTMFFLCLSLFPKVKEKFSLSESEMKDGRLQTMA